MRQGDVFISAASAADNLLEGSANGDWVSWYTTFASSPLMLAYDPDSSFGKQLAQGKPWYQVITEPGILVGRTDPKLDPKGILTVEAVEGAARKLRQPALTQALGSFPVYPETALVGRLQAGQLDAGFFYAVEASSAHLVTVAADARLQVRQLHRDDPQPRRQPDRRCHARALPAERTAQVHAEEERARHAETAVLGKQVRRTQEPAQAGRLLALR